jgi:dTDP-4-amino-4,6-dideoxygalactose transaminase
MSPAVLMALPPLSPRVWLRRPKATLPFPLDEDGCRLYARARQGLAHGLRAAGIGNGDDVLAPAYHHGSEIEALERAGVRCMFYEPGDRLEPDAAELDALRGPRTRALHLVHHLGFPQDAARWRRWCDARGLALIEDVAQSWLGQVGARPAGAFGDIAIFSLYKSFGLPDGGALICRRSIPPLDAGGDRALARLALEHAVWLAGRSSAVGTVGARLRPGRPYDPAADFALRPAQSASLGTVLALPRVADPSAAERRRCNYALLARRLGDLVHPAFAPLPDGAAPFVFPVQAADKPALLRSLRGAGIRALDLWSVPHPSLPRERFPRAQALRAALVGVPVHQELRRRDLARIVEEVRAAA